MISVYHTDEGWCFSLDGAVTYHRDFREAMDAAYRQATRHAAAQRSDSHSNNG